MNLKPFFLASTTAAAACIATASTFAFFNASDDVETPSNEITFVNTSNSTGFTGIPSDAVELFTPDMALWQHKNGDACKWEMTEDNVLISKPGTGGITSISGFGDAQIHLEWMIPTIEENPPRGQNYGNSGIFMMSRYETQILAAHPEENVTYADGIPGCLYNQAYPLVNACKKTGEWHSYDIVFHRPKFDEDGNCTYPGSCTIFLNGVLVQDHTAFVGSTVFQDKNTWHPHGASEPLLLQDHNCEVHFRNAWIRCLED